ncbi:uncharacterized protein LY89DRAFT_784774 [Mollisia scopiformis]|uniref:C2H2-type domain-containing protein n=1 Tax=Mollisia scopiformis TaxID=149040 RepID=A0A194X171_MOLSC|nr:uncharacterized protein LY89DRAFT_784774 [Mollisia scopiformis]KUJ13938.1 hypothetical protein LY89DRAFT_784774 [Mollisia scopiformis]
MPWTIWPSLVVLWGVCWMFHTPFRQQDFDVYLNEDSFSPFSPNFAFDPTFASLPPGSDYFSNNIDFGDGLHEAIHPYPVVSNAIPTSLAEIPAPAASGSAMGAYLQADSSSFGVMPNYSYPAAESIYSMSEVASGIPDHQSHSSITPVPNTSLRFAPSAAPSASSMPPNPVALLPRQASATPYQAPQAPPKDSEGRFVCTYPGCDDNQSFKWLSGWQTHMDKHTRPYQCSVPGCKGNSGFATKGVLDRHTRGEFFDVPEIFEAASASTRKKVTTLEIRKRKRTPLTCRPAQDAVEGEASGSENTTKKARGSADSAQPGHTVEELARENQKLQQEIDKKDEDLKKCLQERGKERETMLRIIDQLTKGTK